MQYNKNPISLREGHAFIDGVKVLDSVKMTVNFTPETWTGRQLGEKNALHALDWCGHHRQYDPAQDDQLAQDENQRVSGIWRDSGAGYSGHHG